MRVGGLLLVLAALCLPARPARAQMSAWPVLIQFPAGREGARAVTVRNEGRDPLQVRFYAGDFEQDETGRHRFLPLGTDPRSCAGRVGVHPDVAVVEPGETATARVSMAPGDSTCWSAVFAETATVRRGGIRIGQRIAVKVYGLGRDSGRDARIDSVEVGSDRVRFVFHNLGAVPLRPKGRLEVRDLDGAVVRSVPIDPASALPGHARDYAVALPGDLPAGTWLAVPVLDIGADYLVGGQALFERHAR